MLDTEGRFTFLNRTGWTLLGYEVDHLIGVHYSTVVDEGDLQKAKYYFNERRTGRRAATGVELRLKLKNNEKQHEPITDGNLIVELNARGIYDRPVDLEKKRFLGTFGVARDISHRRRLEAQLRYTQKMEAIRTLASGIAHEFNNLLQVILGYSELILLNRGNDEPGYDELQEIVAAARKGGKLTQQLLTFSRRNAGNRQPVDLNREVERIKNVL
ncbi:MAG: PAS domain S-box protein, partial [Promethearchaeota archaeon]